MQDKAQTDDASRYASPEEIRYARVLKLGSRIAFLALIAGFLAYVLRILPSRVTVDAMPRYWGLSAREFADATGTPTGWAWLPQIAHGDMLTLAAIALLASVAGFCALAVLPQFLRRGDRLHAAILLLQVLVLVLAASNLFGTGGS